MRSPFSFIHCVVALLALLCSTMASAQPAEVQGTDYRALAAALEDEHTRRVVIEELRRLDALSPSEELAPLPPAEELAQEAPSGQSAEQVSFARRMAAFTSGLAGSMGGQLASAGQALSGLFASSDSSSSVKVDFSGLWSAVFNLAIIALATFAAFFVLRRLSGRAYSALNDWTTAGSERLTMVRTIVAVSVAALVDAVVVAVAYLLGQAVSVQLAEYVGANGTRLSLFLNAFLIIELIKVGLRTVFANRYPALRLAPLDADQAAYCNQFFARLVGAVGYGILVLVPIINFNVSPALGSALSTAITVVAAVYTAIVVIKNRVTVRQRLEARSTAIGGSSGSLVYVLARVWHLLVIAYALLVVAVTLVQPATALPFVVFATLKTLAYAGGGLLLLVILRQLIGKEIQLSEGLNASMPLLQARLNTYIPTALKLVRLLLIIGVVVMSLDAWAVFDLAAWYASAQGSSTVSALVDILIILAVAAAVWIALASAIEHRLTPSADVEPAAAARATTLMGLFHSTLAIVIVVMTTMIALSEIGVDIGPLIAGAGVLGLAIGFGAQKLVQDVITGVFIQLENAMNVGDFVDVGGNSGTVDRVGIRSVALRDLYGTYHIVPFSSVGAVSNFTRDFGNHIGEYGIAYREDIDFAIEQLKAAFEELEKAEIGENILAPINVMGVVALADSSVNIRVQIKTKPGMQWAVGRAYNRLVKLYFDKAGIEIPFPHTTLYFGEDRQGNAPAANVRISDRANVVSTQE